MPNSLPQRLTQTRSDGGLRLTEVTAVAVMPWRRPSLAVEITDTVEGNRRIAARNCSPRSIAIAASTLFANASILFYPAMSMSSMVARDFSQLRDICRGKALTCFGSLGLLSTVE